MVTTMHTMNAASSGLGADAVPADPAALAAILAQGAPEERLAAWLHAGPAGAAAIPALTPLLDSRDPDVVRAAVGAIERIAFYAGRLGAQGEAQAVATALAASLDPGSPHCREVICRLSYVAGDAETPAIARLLQDPFLAEDARLALLRIGTDAARPAVAAPEPLPSPPLPLPQAHAHNDYVHPRPLLDALDCGFCSIEADIHLVDGALLVAHDADEAVPERTLQALYLEPLMHRARTFGAVAPNAPSCQLIIDIKTEAEPTYAALKTLLADYAPMLTSLEGDELQLRAVSAIVSGNRPVSAITSDTSRLVALDGRASDLDSAASPLLMPLLSEDWARYFTWSGDGSFPDDQRRRLENGVARAHAAGRKVRLWNTPHRTEVWDALLAANVDYIGSDDLAMLRDYLLSKRQEA